MNQSNITLLDLPNEILLMILKKLDVIDVLHSFSDTNNKRLDMLVNNNVFPDELNFVKASITDQMLDRLCTYILPSKHHCIRKMILESRSMERILRAGDYPNLTSVELFNFGHKIACDYFTGEQLTS